MNTPSDDTNPLDTFHPATRTWFTETFPTPTPAQHHAWNAINTGNDTLVVAPTGSGKTLAAFLTAIDRLAHTTPTPDTPPGVRILYISPLKALAADVDRNLARPLRGIAAVARRTNTPQNTVTVGIRTGDTSTKDRRAMATTPPDILITTPESLYLLLTSAARTILRNVDMVIIDEIHSLTPTKRGAHLALSLERLDAYAGHRAQRIGLSATARPLDEVGKYLTGGLPYTLVQPPAHKEWDLDIVVPIEDMSLPGQPTGNPTGAASGNEERHSIWPHIENRLLDLITTHRSTLIFVNSRRVAERLTARINEEWDTRNTPNETTTDTPTTPPPEPPILARAHHGSVSSEQRTHIEEALKSGQLPAVIATSSLELGIDMGEIDLVAHIDAPPSVASGLQRVGRAGHQVGARSHGIFLPTHRSDLIRTTVVCERMRAGLIETLHIPTNPLDVLAQHIVAMCAMDDWTLPELTNLIRRTASYATIPTTLLNSVLDMLAGRYPDENFAGLRPRIIWDRSTDTLTGRPGSQRIAVTSGGTIPDRGQFGVFLIGEGPGRRVGELEEEMVYESRVGDVFTLGTSSWRIEEITHDQVLVTPAPGIPGRLPFWRGDAEGREAELGAAIGAFMHEIATLPHDTAINRATTAGLDTWAATNLVTYIHEQKTATGAVPSQNTIILEIFPDELGDTQIVIHSPWGSRVNAPWSLAIAARLRQRFGIDPHPMHADDGIILRLPETTPTDDNTPTTHQLLTEIAELITIDPDEITDIITNEVGGSALFASRFRECASRALLLPRRNPAARQALWQQRRRSAQLLEVASRYPEFPIVLETLRECMQDVFDVPALKTLMTNLTNRRTRIHAINTPTPSPMARTLLFGYIAQFLYEGDSPLAERRAAALSIDPELLADILGTHTTSMRELLDPTIVEHTEAQLQALDPERSPRNIEETFDLIRRIGPLNTTEITTRTHPHTDATTTTTWIHELHNRRRIMPITMAGEQRWAPVEDAGRLLDALGITPPSWVPSAHLTPPQNPLTDLIIRYARCHAPFTTTDLATRLGLGEHIIRTHLHHLENTGNIITGELHPANTGQDHCDPEILRLLRRRSLAALRAQVEPVTPTTYAQYLTTWHGITTETGTPQPQEHGTEGLLHVIEQLAGYRLPASALETLILPTRITNYTPTLLDDLLTRGEITWQGNGSTAGDDGWISLHLTDDAPNTLHTPTTTPPPESIHATILTILATGGGFFFPTLANTVREHITTTNPTTPPPNNTTISDALWDLVWDGHIVNDTFTPMRALLNSTRTTHKQRPRPPRPTRLTRRNLRTPTRTTTPDPTPPRLQGRWSLLPPTETDPTTRTLTTADILLERHGILTRAATTSENTDGGFTPIYRILTHAEETGNIRRGYFIEGLGASQFATNAALDQLRTHNENNRIDTTPPQPPALILAATDPANPYGAALPWPTTNNNENTTHRPGRKAGALVILHAGKLCAYIERGGRTLLTFGDTTTHAHTTATALSTIIDTGHLPQLTITTIDGTPALQAQNHPLHTHLLNNGFHLTPNGLRKRHARR